MKKIILTFLVLSSINLCFSQKQITYWNGIPWNSSEQEILNKQNSEFIKLDKAETYSGAYCNYIIENENLFGNKFTVHFLIDSVSNQLKSILFKHNLVKSEKKINKEVAYKYYNSLMSNISNKYGIPQNKEKSDHSQSAIWFFDTTIVSLSYFHMEIIGLQNLTINYEMASQGNHFRKVRWGATPETVKSSEKLSPLFDKENLVGYESELVGMKCLIGYLFTNEVLTRGRYLMKEKHSNKNDFLNDYLKLKKLLTKKYGKPTHSDDKTWYNDLYKSDFKNWGFAISLGHLSLKNSWYTPDTEIHLNLSGDNYKIKHLLEYTSKRFKNIEEEKQEEEQLNDL